MLNEKIKNLRCAMRLNQVELAEKLNVSKQTISNWENNNIQPSIDTIIKISNFFGVTTDYLLGIDNDKHKLLDISSLTNDEIEDIQKIINHICKCRKEG